MAAQGNRGVRWIEDHASQSTFASHLGLAGSAPFLVDADATLAPGGWPKGGTVVLALPNSHLTYALT
jgi:cytochrome oxidase assembly protein ShyY1